MGSARHTSLRCAKLWAVRNGLERWLTIFCSTDLSIQPLCEVSNPNPFTRILLPNFLRTFQEISFSCLIESANIKFASGIVATHTLVDLFDKNRSLLLHSFCDATGPEGMY